MSDRAFKIKRHYQKRRRIRQTQSFGGWRLGWRGAGRGLSRPMAAVHATTCPVLFQRPTWPKNGYGQAGCWASRSTRVRMRGLRHGAINIPRPSRDTRQMRPCELNPSGAGHLCPWYRVAPCLLVTHLFSLGQLRLTRSSPVSAKMPARSQQLTRSPLEILFDSESAPYISHAVAAGQVGWVQCVQL